MLRAGADFIKLCSSGSVITPSGEPEETANFTVEEIEVMVYEARVQKKTCMAHSMSLEGVRNAVTAGVGSIEHGPVLDEEVVAEMVKKRIFWVPTFRTFQAMGRRATGTGAERFERLNQSLLESFTMAKEAGVKIAFGSDTGSAPHGGNAEELSHLVDAGMSPMEALVAATQTASECMGLNRDLGTIEQGKIADLLVIDGDPLEDIAMLEDRSRISMVLQAGQVHKDLITPG